MRLQKTSRCGDRRHDEELHSMWIPMWSVATGHLSGMDRGKDRPPGTNAIKIRSVGTRAINAIAISRWEDEDQELKLNECRPKGPRREQYGEVHHCNRPLHNTTITPRSLITHFSKHRTYHGSREDGRFG